MANEIDNAYIAGIIDGEGTVELQKYVNWNTYDELEKPICSIANTHMYVLCWIQDRFGGLLKQQRSTGYGKKRCYVLRFRRAEIEVLLEAVSPYLIIKKKKALKVLQYCKTHKANSPRLKLVI
jgi:hypothetical protein